jgi:hypothetical protein
MDNSPGARLGLDTLADTVPVEIDPETPDTAPILDRIVLADKAARAVRARLNRLGKRRWAEVGWNPAWFPEDDDLFAYLVHQLPEAREILAIDSEEAAQERLYALRLQQHELELRYLERPDDVEAARAVWRYDILCRIAHGHVVHFRSLRSAVLHPYGYRTAVDYIEWLRDAAAPKSDGERRLDPTSLAEVLAWLRAHSPAAARFLRNETDDIVVGTTLSRETTGSPYELIRDVVGLHVEDLAQLDPRERRERWGRINRLVLDSSGPVPENWIDEGRVSDITIRDQIELELAEWALASRVPILASGRGAAIVSRALGLPLQRTRPGNPHVLIPCEPNSYFPRRDVVKSRHYQAPLIPAGSSVRAIARDPDGVIEVAAAPGVLLTLFSLPSFPQSDASTRIMEKFLFEPDLGDWGA